MLKPLATIAALAVGAALASPAAAQTFDPKPGTYAFSGPVTVLASINLTCTVTVNFSVDALGAETVTSRSVTGGAPCALVTPYGVWAVDAGPGLTTVTLTMGFSAGLSPICYGTFPAALTVMSLNSTAAFGPLFVPPAGSGPGCTLRGSLTSSGPLTIVP